MYLYLYKIIYTLEMGIIISSDIYTIMSCITISYTCIIMHIIIIFSTIFTLPSIITISDTCTPNPCPAYQTCDKSSGKPKCICECSEEERMSIGKYHHLGLVA